MNTIIKKVYLGDIDIDSLKFNWHTTMAKPQVNHVKTVLDKLYGGKIDMADSRRKTEEETKPIFYSRALAAYYLHINGISIEESIQAITDGYNDHGIDAIYYDEQTSTLHLIQSKIINEGVGEPANGDLLKFKEGILDLIDEKFDDRFNRKISNKKTEIIDALANRNTKLNIVLVYTGKGFADHNNLTIKDFMERLNDTSDWAMFTDFNLKAIHGTLSSSTSQKPIEEDITLSNWGPIDEPYKSYYGQISAYALAQIYITHGKRLFNENIRSFIGLSSINSEMLKTIQNEPENFIYFNNGVVIICDEIEPIPGKTLNKGTGSFHCKGMQIINGAQTVGTLGGALGKYEESLKRCSLFVRLIALNQCPEGFGTRITMASNTQNKIEKKDFVSLDPIQHNIRTELGLAGITYNYKRSEDAAIIDEKNCSLEEATIALAAFNEDVANCVHAKRELGKLWEDIKSPPYTTLFNDKLRISSLWNMIKVFREVLRHLSKRKEDKDGREKSTYTYGNYFILHVFFCLLPREKLYNPRFDVDQFLQSKEFTDLFDWIIDSVYRVGENTYPSSLIHQLYRNQSKCSDMKIKILSLANSDNKLKK